MQRQTEGNRHATRLPTYERPHELRPRHRTARNGLDQRRTERLNVMHTTPHAHPHLEGGNEVVTRCPYWKVCTEPTHIQRRTPILRLPHRKSPQFQGRNGSNPRHTGSHDEMASRTPPPRTGPKRGFGGCFGPIWIPPDPPQKVPNPIFSGSTARFCRRAENSPRNPVFRLT